MRAHDSHYGFGSSQGQRLRGTLRRLQGVNQEDTRGYCHSLIRRMSAQAGENSLQKLGDKSLTSENAGVSLKRLSARQHAACV